eukprot:183203-Pyramimonas_sp.AAC.1
MASSGCVAQNVRGTNSKTVRRGSGGGQEGHLEGSPRRFHFTERVLVNVVVGDDGAHHHDDVLVMRGGA